MATIKIEKQQSWGEGGETDVTREYVDYHDAHTLREAYDYTKETGEKVLEEAKNFVTNGLEEEAKTRKDADDAFSARLDGDEATIRSQGEQIQQNTEQIREHHNELIEHEKESEQMKANVARNTGNIQKNADAIAAETTARTDADAAFDTRLTEETDAREALEGSLATETSERKAVDQTLTENLATANGKITANEEAIQQAQSDIAGLQAKSSDLDTKIDNAVSQLERADTTLEGKIAAETTARTTAETEINSKITTNTANIATNTAGIKKINDTTVVKSVGVNADGSTDVVKVDVGSGTIGDGSTVNSIPLPVASSTQAGVMNAATFNAIEGIKEGMNALANEAVAVSGVINDQSSQQEITAAWKSASGSEYEEPIPGASIFDSTNEVMFRYYGNTKTWELIQDGLAAQIDLSQFTNTKAGLIKGSQTAGQVFAESDGTGSVNGWDALSNDVKDLKTNSATKDEVATTYATKTELEEIELTPGPQGEQGEPGEPGKDGAPGANGKDGFSPTVATTAVEGGTQVTITDATGPKNFTVLNGPQGPAGPAGANGTNGKDGAAGAKGADGVTPHIGDNGNWFIGTTDTEVSAKGPKGDMGTVGPAGPNNVSTTTSSNITGILKGTGSAVAVAVEGTDYSLVKEFADAEWKTLGFKVV